jgi:hypothetical protein
MAVERGVGVNSFRQRVYLLRSNTGSNRTCRVHRTHTCHIMWSACSTIVVIDTYMVNGCRCCKLHISCTAASEHFHELAAFITSLTAPRQFFPSWSQKLTLAESVSSCSLVFQLSGKPPDMALQPSMSSQFCSRCKAPSTVWGDPVDC